MEKAVAGRAPVSDRGQREDAFIWALKVAEQGVPVSDVLADADVIRAYMGGELAPTAQAIVTVQRYRDRLGLGTTDVGAVDEFLGDLIRDLCESVVDAEVVEDEPRRPDWADVAQFADITAERDRARDTAVRLEQELEAKARELDETRQHLIKGVLLEVLRAGHAEPERSGVWVARYAATKFGVEL